MLVLQSHIDSIIKERTLKANRMIPMTKGSTHIKKLSSVQSNGTHQITRCLFVHLVLLLMTFFRASFVNNTEQASSLEDEEL